jgi:carboxyl-terminal processing protease
VTLRIPVVSIAPLYAFGQATRASARIVERNGRRIGYVHVWASVGEESAQALSGALSILGLTSPDKVGAVFFPKGYMRAPQPERRGLDGLIIDMRGKIGGTGSNAGRYLDILDARGPAVRSRGAGPGWTRDLSLRGRTAVLIDRRTRSTAELFVHAYKRERQGALIGTRTAGAVSGAGAWTMPGGNLLYLAGVGLEVDGEILEGRGVAPDIEVVRPVPYAAGADPVLEAALDHLARLPPQPAPKPASKPGRGEW